jgi:hypothetical protein
VSKAGWLLFSSPVRTCRLWGLGIVGGPSINR